MFIDLATIARSLEDATHRPVDGADLAARLHGFASTRGRVAVAQVYADWSHSGAPPAFDFLRHQVTPCLVPQDAAGPSRAQLVLALDVVESLYAPVSIDEYLIVSEAPRLQELALRLRRHDRTVVFCGVRGSAPQELVRAAHHFVALEDVLLLPAAPRSGVEGAAGVPTGAEAGFDEQDVNALILLINRLEQRLDFVGVGYLIGKAMAHNGVGAEDIRVRRALFNRLADDGVVEVYKLDNKEAGADPVSACRLDRSHPRVAELGDAGPPDDDGEQRFGERMP